MAESKYWFARRFPVGHPRNAMSPVTPEGFRVVYTFLGWMIGGVVAAGVVAALGVWIPFAWVLAPFVFVACAAYGGWYFIKEAQSRGDHQHTVDDYKQGRV